MFYTVKMYCNISNVIKRLSVVGRRRTRLRCSLRTWTGTRFYISVLLKCLGVNGNILPKTWRSRSCCRSSLWQLKFPRVAELATLWANPLCPVKPNTGRTSFTVNSSSNCNTCSLTRICTFRLESNERESCRAHREQSLVLLMVWLPSNTWWHNRRHETLCMRSETCCRAECSFPPVDRWASQPRRSEGQNTEPQYRSSF